MFSVKWFSQSLSSVNLTSFKIEFPSSLTKLMLLIELTSPFNPNFKNFLLLFVLLAPKTEYNYDREALILLNTVH
jgi:hypothetical protein